MSAAPGVPIEHATSPDFLMVRAALVRTVGGANEALVWTRIHYRCTTPYAAQLDEDGETWWRASLAIIAEETGLSSDQVRRALKALTAGGFIASTKLRTGGAYDQTLAYRPVLIGAVADVAKSPDRGGEIAESMVAESPNVHVANSPDVPLKDIKTSTPRKRGSRIPEPFMLKADMREWAREKAPAVFPQLDVHTREFVDYWRAAAGASAVKLDWVAAWRVWMTKAHRYRLERDPQAARAAANPTPRRTFTAEYEED